MVLQNRIRRWQWLSALIIAAVFVSTAAAQSIIVTEAENGTTINIAEGDLLVVTLESNPSTGFEWQVTKDDVAMLKPSGPPEFHPDVFWMTGTIGHQVFKFRAISSGTGTIELQYRALDRSGARAKTFSVIIAIK